MEMNRPVLLPSGCSQFGETDSHLGSQRQRTGSGGVSDGCVRSRMSQAELEESRCGVRESGPHVLNLLYG